MSAKGDSVFAFSLPGRQPVLLPPVSYATEYCTYAKNNAIVLTWTRLVETPCDLTLDLTRYHLRHQVIFKFNLCKICTSCEFEIY